MKGTPLAVGIGTSKGGLELLDGFIVAVGFLQTLTLDEVVTCGCQCAREAIDVEDEVRRCTRLDMDNDGSTTTPANNDCGLFSGICVGLGGLR